MLGAGHQETGGGGGGEGRRQCQRVLPYQAAAGVNKWGSRSHFHRKLSWIKASVAMGSLRGLEGRFPLSAKWMAGGSILARGWREAAGGSGRIH